MQVSVELTMYPLQEEFIPKILAFIEKLNQEDDLKIQTFPTATIICGDYDKVMDCIKETIRWSTETQGKAVFLTKILPTYWAL